MLRGATDFREEAHFCCFLTDVAAKNHERVEMNPMDVVRERKKPREKRNSGRVRWWIAWTLFFSTVTNYISRQTFSVLAPLITAQYHLTHTDLAKILGPFQVSYAITWFVGGIFLDVVGTRI